MKTLLIVVSLISLNLQAKIFTVPRAIKNGSNLEFQKNEGNPKYFKTYLSMDLPFEAAKVLYLQLLDFKGKSKTQFITRGEAHITVVSPVEYLNELRRYLTPQELSQVGEDMSIQDSYFQIKCLGKGKDTLPELFAPKLNDNKTKLQFDIIGKEKEETYFIVVASKDITKIRTEVLRRAKINARRDGLPMPVFKPKNIKYQPHITIGFTKQDLHSVDKSHKACGRNRKNLRVTR